jgi:hypothetical protein
MDFGQLISNAAVNAGNVMIAGAEQQQRQASAENTQAEARMRQMNALMMKQDMEEKKAITTEMAGANEEFGKGAKTDQEVMTYANKGAATAAAHGRFDLMKGYEDMAKSAETALKTSIENKAKETAALHSAVGSAAIDYVNMPSEEGATALRDAAVKAGVKPDSIPLRTDPQFASWAKGMQTYGLDSGKRIEHMDKEQDLKRQQEERERHNKEVEEQRRAAEVDKAAARETTKLLLQQGLEIRRQSMLDREERAKKGGEAGKVEQKISDGIIRNAAQVQRVLTTSIAATAKSSGSIFTHLGDGTLTEALVRSGTQAITPTDSKAMDSLQAEMGTVMAQILTAGSGRGPNMPLQESMQKLNQTLPTDPPIIKLFRLANAAEAVKLELDNIVPGGTPKLEENRQNMIKFFDKFPSTAELMSQLGEKDPKLGKQLMSDYMATHSGGAGGGGKPAATGVDHSNPLLR